MMERVLSELLEGYLLLFLLVILANLRRRLSPPASPDASRSHSSRWPLWRDKAASCRRSPFSPRGRDEGHWSSW
jgi:hypothetical protein